MYIGYFDIYFMCAYIVNLSVQKQYFYKKVILGAVSLVIESKDNIYFVTENALILCNMILYK